MKTDLALEGRWARTYSRPNFEVNERVQQETVGARLFLRRSLSERFALALSGNAQRIDTETTGVSRHESRLHADAGSRSGRWRAADGAFRQDAARGRGRGVLVPLPEGARAERTLDARLRRVAYGRDGPRSAARRSRACAGSSWIPAGGATGST